MHWGMLHMKKFLNFAKNESGAVTVDWVVLTAGIVVLAGLVLLALNGIDDKLKLKVETSVDKAVLTQ